MALPMFWRAIVLSGVFTIFCLLPGYWKLFTMVWRCIELAPTTRAGTGGPRVFVFVFGILLVYLKPCSCLLRSCS